MDTYHILIVEDDKEIREGIEIYLRNQGYIVFQAADGIEGLEQIKKEEIHLAIVDVMMPRMDGINMMMRVRELGYEFPVIMLSAKSEEVDKIMGLNMGADDERMMTAFYYAEQYHPFRDMRPYRNDFETFKADWTAKTYDPGSAFTFDPADVEEIETLCEEVLPPDPAPAKSKQRKRKRRRK